MKAQLKTWISSLLKIGLSTGIITWLVLSGRLSFAGLKFLLEPSVFITGFLITGIVIFIASERWRGILKTKGFKLKPIEALKLTLVGSFFNFAVPGGVGGDVVKGYYIVKSNPQQRLRAVLTIAIDRLLGLFAMMLMAIIVMLLEWRLVSQQKELLAIFTLLSSLFLGFMVFWCFIFSRRFYKSGFVQKFISLLPQKQHLMTLYDTFAEYREQKASFFKAIGLSFLSQGLSVTFFILCGYAMGHTEISIATYYFVVPIGFMVTAIPISPAGVGVGQAAFLFLFNSALGTPSDIGTLSITAYQIINLIFGLFGAGIYLSIRDKK